MADRYLLLRIIFLYKKIQSNGSQSHCSNNTHITINFYQLLTYSCTTIFPYYENQNSGLRGCLDKEIDKIDENSLIVQK